MHIALVAPEFPPEIGGMQTYAVEFARELVARGHRVTVLTRRRSEEQPRFPGMAIEGVLTGRYRADLARMRQVQADGWHVMNAAYAWVASHFRPTLVSIHGNDFLRPYIPVGAPDLGSIPGFWRSQRLRPALERWLEPARTARLVRTGLLRATRILANSRYTEQVFLKQYPECRGKTVAAMVGVAAEFLDAPLPSGGGTHAADTLAPGSAMGVAGSGFVPKPGGTRLITVCRLSEDRKNVGLVLDALARLRDRYAYTYTVVGDGPLRPVLERQAATLGVADRVRFLGFLTPQAMQQELMCSDLFVLTAGINPASHEGFGIAYLEANACGVPTVAARLAGAIEAVDEDVSGCFAEPLDVGGVARALSGFFSGEKRFAPAACRAFARGFSWARVVDVAMPWYGGAARPSVSSTTAARA